MLKEDLLKLIMKHVEDAFDTIAHSKSDARNVHKIPNNLLTTKREWKQKKAKTNAKKYTMRSFEYDIGGRYFHNPKFQEVNSLFFEGVVCTEYGSEDFVYNNFFVLKFNEFRMDDSILDRDKTVEQILREGIELGNKLYNIIGCSNSQVQKKYFVYMAGTRGRCDEYIRTFIPTIDDLEEKKGVAKRTKYAGLLFTGCQFIVSLPEFEWIINKDYKNKGYNFTDGCGLISYKLAEEIRSIDPTLIKIWKEIPSVWQIRYYGHGHICKGVLIVDHTETERNILVMRDSMLKVQVNENSQTNNILSKILGIVSTSINPKIGSLNKQVIALLSANVDIDILKTIQSDHFKSIKDARINPEAAAKCAAMKRQWSSLMAVFRQHSIDVLPKAYSSLIRSIEPSAKKVRKKDKFQIPLASSRLLFGVSIPEHLHDILHEGQCICLTEFGYHKGPVIVSRSPSYSTGDIRILQAVTPRSDSSISKLKNVIIFSTRGNRPDPDKMSGGDLDGDLYLVIWDSRLLKYKEKIENEKPMDYDQENNATWKKTTTCNKTEDWLRYVARWENTLLAQIDSCFFQLAAEHGVKSKECHELCELFSRAVDQNPSDLEKLRKLSSKCSTRRTAESIICRPDHKLPVWEQLLKGHLKFIADLEVRTKFPTNKEWSIFYNRLIHMDQSMVKDMLRNPEFTECVEKEELLNCEILWKNLCIGLRNLSVVDKPSSSEISCTFDCIDKTCPLTHEKNPAFYKSKWDKRMHTGIYEVISGTMMKADKAKDIIDTQEEHLKKGQQLEREAFHQYEYELQKVLERRRIIEKLAFTLIDIKEGKKDLNILASKIRDRTFKQRVFSLVSCSYSSKLSKKQKNAIERVETQEERLVELYNQCTHEENDMRRCFGLTPAMSLGFDELQRPEAHKEKEKDLNKLMNDCREHKLLHSPMFHMVPSSIENLEELYCSTLAKQEDIKYQQYIAMKKVQDVKNQLKINSKHIGDSRICINNIDQILTMLEKLQDICDKCVLVLDNEGSQNQSQIHENAITLFESNLLQNRITESDLDVLLNGKRNDKRLIFSNILEEINLHQGQYVDRQTKEYVRQERLGLENDNLMKRLKKNELTLTGLKKDFENETKKLTYYDNMRDKVYDGNKMLKATELYERISDETITKCFNLVLCALSNEVEDRFSHVDTIKDEDRIIFTRELELCLRRERKRCQKELSDNKLPVFSKRSAILEALLEYDAVIVFAETGSGKSTQIPQYLADDLHHAFADRRFPKIACTQPRRVAATRIAERVALEYAGAIDVMKTTPKPKLMVKNRYGPTKITAYPLYASLEQTDQDRALNEYDRVGYNKVYNGPVPAREKRKEGAADSLTGTMGEVGGWVGFQIGSKGKSGEDRKRCKKLSNETRIHFVTEGLLLQKLKSNTDFDQYQCIVIDEAHERGKDTDLLLSHLHNIVNNAKKNAINNLKVVVMSASIDQKTFSNYFGGCPIIECEGHMFNVDVIYMEVPSSISCNAISSPTFDSETVESDSDENSSESDEESNTDILQNKSSQMHNIIVHAVDVVFTEIVPREEPGDVLLFLPGRREINLCVDMINKRAEEANEENDKKYDNVRKVVCCTNIAETSLTIPGVRFVLDGGKVKKKTLNHKLRVSALKLQDIPQASAKQRKGRAGRVQEGFCYRLYSEYHFQTMSQYDEPEMKQCPIDELYLYTLDVFGCLEKIDLMPDAQPDDEAIQCGKERLFNLGYIEEMTMTITTAGRFALMFLGDLTLESARMILAAKELGIVEDALTLAVLLQEEEDIFVKKEHENEERKKFHEETGDHLTLMNIYKHFEQKLVGKGTQFQNEKRARRWCENICVSFDMLKQVRTSIDKIYTTLKRHKDYGTIVEGFRKTPTNTKNSHNDHLVKNKEELLKAIVAGYFHNIVEPNDLEYIKAGYSLITPTNYGKEITGANDVNLLKVDLSRESAIFFHGDTKKNSLSIFNTLFMIPKVEKVYMQVVTKIKSEWILGYASKRWKQSIGLKFQRCQNMEDVEIISYIRRQTERYIGPAILGAIKKEDNERKKPIIASVSKVSNAKIWFLFDTAEIKFYGSQKEIYMATPEILKLVDGKINEFKSNDNVVRHPRAEGKSPVCDIKLGFKVTKFESSLITVRIEDWKSNQSVLMFSTLIFLKTPQNEEHRINIALEKVKPKLSSQLYHRWEKPRIIICNSNLTKVCFQSQEIANDVCRLLQPPSDYGFPKETKCFLDREIRIRVKETSLYPSVETLAKNFHFVEVKNELKSNSFIIKLHKKTPRSYQYQLTEFIQCLRDKKVFGSCIIENLNMSEEKELIYRQVKKRIGNMDNKLIFICYKEYPAPTIEIYGEYEQRENAKRNLLEYIWNLKCTIEQGSQYTQTYHKELRIDTRKQFASILTGIKKVQDDHKNVTISILGGGDHHMYRSSARPVVQMLSDNNQDGENAEKHIKDLLKVDGNSADRNDRKCSRCLRRVHLPLHAKEKQKEREMLKKGINKLEKRRNAEAGENEDSVKDIKKKIIWTENHDNLPEACQLKLCGCLYCRDCLRDMIYLQLQEQAALLEHEEVVCQQCEQTILINDLYLLSKENKENLYDQALRNFLLTKYTSSTQNKLKLVPDQCSLCGTLMLRPSKKTGVYQCINKQCQRISCLKCGGSVMNEMEFYLHENCGNT